MDPRRYNRLNIFVYLMTSACKNQTTALAARRFISRGHNLSPTEALGQLVPLGFGVATFTPAAYQRHRL